MESRKNKKKFPLAFKKKVEEAAVAIKRELKAEKPADVWNAKKRKWTKWSSQIGYKLMIARELFSEVKEETCDSPDFKSCVQFVRRCYKLLVTGKFKIEGKQLETSFVLLGQAPQGNVPVWGRNFLTFSLVCDPHSRQDCQRRFSWKGRNLYTVILLSGNVKMLNLKCWALVIDGWKTGAKSTKFQLKNQARDFS